MKAVRSLLDECHTNPTREWGIGGLQGLWLSLASLLPTPQAHFDFHHQQDIVHPRNPVIWVNWNSSYLFHFSPGPTIPNALQISVKGFVAKIFPSMFLTFLFFKEKTPLVPRGHFCPQASSVSYIQGWLTLSSYHPWHVEGIWWVHPCPAAPCLHLWVRLACGTHIH